MLDKNLLEIAFYFHGHKCPAMPLGLRAGLLALRKLRVERASDKELFCFLETGPAHATMCFGDGVQFATGCTYGKGNIEKLNYSKNAFTLIDIRRKKAIRVALNPEFQKKGLASRFVQMRKEGVEPEDIPSEVVMPLIEKIMETSDEELFKISKIFNYDFEPKKSTFEWHECEKCGEVVFAHKVRLMNGRKLCIPCSQYGE